MKQNHLTAWSNSRADVYRQCPYHAKLRFLTKHPELPRPLPQGKTEHANTRGKRIHDHAELVVKQGAALSSELLKFKEEIRRAQGVAAKWPELIETEEMWCFNNEWEAVPKDRFDLIWLRVIIDLNITTSPESKLLVDYKSGKKFGNEVKHHEQMTLYTLATFLKYPAIEEVTAELWYLDVNDVSSTTRTREQSMKLFNKFHNLGLRITGDTDFEARPSLSSCRFCPYRTGSNKWVTGTGDCKRNPPDKTELSEGVYHQRRNEGLLMLKEQLAANAKRKR